MRGLVSKGHFPIFRPERHSLLFKDQLVESGRQKTKENMIPRRKFRLVENGLEETIDSNQNKPEITRGNV